MRASPSESFERGVGRSRRCAVAMSVGMSLLVLLLSPPGGAAAAPAGAGTHVLAARAISDQAAGGDAAVMLARAGGGAGLGGGFRGGGHALGRGGLALWRGALVARRGGIVLRRGIRHRVVVVPRGYALRAWRRPGHYWWRPGRALAEGAAVEFIGSSDGASPVPRLCWYYVDRRRANGFWDICPSVYP